MSGDRRDDAGEGGGDEPLGAAWGGSDGSSETAGEPGSGPLPRAEEVDRDTIDAPGQRAGPPDLSWLDRLSIFLQDHRTAFTIALLVYGLLVMPWLYQNDLETVGFVGGALFLGGVVLVTAANVSQARDAFSGGEDRRRY
jgi:hypothetical protein